MTSVNAPGVRRVALLLFAATWCGYVGTTGGTLATGDAVAMFEAAKSLIDRGAMDVPASQSSELWRGVDDRYYTPFGIGQSLYDIPFLVAGRWVTSLTGLSLGDPDTLPKAFVAAASTVPAAAAVAFGFLLAWRLSGDAWSSAVTAAVLGFGTLLWPYAKFGFNAALTAGLLSGGVYGIVAGVSQRRSMTVAAGATALGLALLTRHEMAIAAVVCLVWVAWITRGDSHARPLVVACVCPVLLAIGAWLALNAVRFGDPFRTGHDPEFSTEGLRAYLVSPSGALLLYAPPAIAAVGLITLTRAGNRLAALLLAVCVAMTLFYGSLEDWLGTRSYGPRYLVPLLPLLVAPLAVWVAAARTVLSRSALAILCAIGIAVQIPGVAIDFSRAGIAAGQPSQTIRRDDWRWTPLVVNVRMLPRASSTSVNAMLSRTSAASVGPRSDSLADRLPFGLDLWWMHLFQLGILPRTAAIVLGLVPILTAGLLFQLAIRTAFTVKPPTTPV